MTHLCGTLLKIAIAALIFYLALMMGHSNAQAANWPTLDRIASTVTDQHVDVTCSDTDDSLVDWMPNHIWGYTYPGQPASVTLSRLVCAGLLFALTDPTGKQKWQLYTYKTPGYGTDNSIVEGYALHVFTHELRHVTVGYSLFTGAADDLARTERDAECWATSHDIEMAERFGMTEKRAAYMHIYGSFLHDQLPAIYRDGDCP